MKLPFKSVAISTISHATESVKKLKSTIRLLVPEEIEIEEAEAEGHYGDLKFILSADIQRRPLLRSFWDNLIERLSEGGKEWLKRNAERRLAEDCRLYLRFDKQLAVSEGELSFTDSGDVIHVRINISAYPAKRDIALEKLKEFIESDFEYG